MIKTISIKNFKSHADTTIKLGRVTALVGPNGCGKTSVLQALKLLGDFVGSGWDRSDEFTDYVRRQTSSSTVSVTGRVSDQGNSPDDVWKLTLTIKSNDVSPSATFFQHDEEKRIDSIGRNSPLNREWPSSAINLLQEPFFLKSWSAVLAKPFYSVELKPKLHSDGSNLASVLAYLKKEEDEIFAAIEGELQNLVPTIRKIRPRQTKSVQDEKQIDNLNGQIFVRNMPREVLADKLTFDTKSGDNIPAHLISEGALLLLCLLTALHAPAAPHLFLLDDIEHGLHPLAQHQLMQLLNAFAEKHHKQIILTSHSPYIVDKFKADNVWVMATDKEGISHCQQLSKGPNAEFGLKVLTTGEFLDAEGEEWVLDPPVQEEPAHV